MRYGIIYVLIDPQTNLIRYVGQTIVKINTRYNGHISKSKKTKGKISHVNSWIRHLSYLNLKPIIEIIEDNISENQLDNKEIQYIKLFKSVGSDLCNHTNGGGGIRGFKQSKESINKRIESCKNSIRWYEKSKKHSIKMKDLHKEGKVKLGYGHLSEDKRKEIGRKHSEKMKEIYKSNPEHIKKLYESRRIKVFSITDNLEFDSVSDAGKYYKIDSSYISRVCKGKSKQTHGISFKYL